MAVLAPSGGKESLYVLFSCSTCSEVFGWHLEDAAVETEVLKDCLLNREERIKCFLFGAGKRPCEHFYFCEFVDTIETFGVNPACPGFGSIAATWTDYLYR